MVTLVKKVTSWQHPHYEYMGLSTDTKPDREHDCAPENSFFFELDTGKSYYFSADEWHEMPKPF